MMLNNLLLSSFSFSDLLCDVDQCLSYIIILLNILTVFYLAFTSNRQTVFTRILGTIWTLALAGGTGYIVYLHTCLFTLLCSLFSLLGILAILTAICSRNYAKNSESKQKDPYKKLHKARGNGCYVIYGTDDQNFVFALHDKKKRLIAKSVYKYKTMDEVRDAIDLCREAGLEAQLDNSTLNWRIDIEHPKFRVYLKNRKYYADLALDEEFIILKSEPIATPKKAIELAKLAISCIDSDIVFFAKGRQNIMRGRRYSKLQADGEETTQSSKSKKSAIDNKFIQTQMDLQMGDEQSDAPVIEIEDIFVDNSEEAVSKNASTQSDEIVEKVESVKENPVAAQQPKRLPKIKRNKGKLAVQEIEKTKEHTNNNSRPRSRKRKRWFGSRRK